MLDDIEKVVDDFVNDKYYSSGCGSHSPSLSSGMFGEEKFNDGYQQEMIDKLREYERQMVEDRMRIEYEKLCERKSYEERPVEEIFRCHNCEQTIYLWFKRESVSPYPLMSDDLSMVTIKHDNFYCPKCGERYNVSGEVIGVKSKMG